MASRAGEDYLKAIYELEMATGVAKTSQIADKLNLKAATVTEMVQRMAVQEPPAVTYRSHYGVRLTAQGKKSALMVIRRHRILETFLHQTLGFGWDEVHEEAEILEHHLSERLTRAIEEFLGFPKLDPHGEPIPDHTGQIDTPERLKLTDLDSGQEFKIVGVDPESVDLLTYLKANRIGLGTTGRIIAKETLEGSLSLSINGPRSKTDVHLVKWVTDRIFVTVLGR